MTKKRERSPILFKKYSKQIEEQQEIDKARERLQTEEEITIKNVSTGGKAMELTYRILVNLLKLAAMIVLFGLASFGLTILVNTSLREAVWELLRQMI